jgi:chaperonin GroES
MPKDSKCPLKPFAQNVVVLPDLAPEKIGSIYLPDQARKKAYRGTVLAVGPGKRLEDGKRGDPPEVKVGNRIYYKPYTGVEVELPGNGGTLLVLHEDDIVAMATDLLDERLEERVDSLLRAKS